MSHVVAATNVRRGRFAEAEALSLEDSFAMASRLSLEHPGIAFTAFRIADDRAAAVGTFYAGELRFKAESP
jgi:hypothetical protein